MLLNEFLQAEAARLGFPLFGVAPVAQPPHISSYESWIAAGLHAGMSYLAAERALERRANPHLIEPQARSLLVVALRYFAPDSYTPTAEGDYAPDGEALGRIAAYAWGDDYHDIIPPLLTDLLHQMEVYLGRPVHSRPYTDTGPILERDFAQQAGLGWSGKNTCLIHPRQGSFFLLGEAFVDAEVEPSAPFRTDQCGSCHRCIDACPTACIRPDRTIDSGRCISYQTIENKASIPVELRAQIGDWVFGCDICQSVCPWNLRFATPTGHPALAPRPGLPRPVLRKELRLSAQEFNRKFKRSPIQRAKRRGYLRNVAVALGNQADPASIPDLAQTLAEEPEPLVRAHAAWALGRMRSKRARQALEKSLKQEPDPTVAAEMRLALA